MFSCGGASAALPGSASQKMLLAEGALRVTRSDRICGVTLNRYVIHHDGNPKVASMNFEECQSLQ